MANNMFLNMAAQQLKQKSQAKCYEDDFQLWAKERLGIHVWSKQAEIAQALINNRKVAVKSSHGIGKAQPLDTILPTPNGYASMEEVAVGDFVLDEQGKPTEVLAKSPVWNLDTFEVLFDDGTTARVNGQHEWTVQDLTKRKKGVTDWRDEWDSAYTYETQELLEMGLKTNSDQWRWRVPMAKPLDLPEQDLLIDPYVLGVWLGGGTSSMPNITSHPDDFEIMARISETENVKKFPSALYGYSLGGDHDKGLFRYRLRNLGILGDKRIPTQYLRASYEQRLELLRGIMDSDGSVGGEGGSASIDWTKKDLAEDLAELIASLGWKVSVRESDAKLYGRVVSKRYRMSFRTDRNPFYLKRKAMKWKSPGSQASRYTQRTIVSIEQIDSVSTQCITVDSENSLYLTGRQMVPTHNSYIASLIIAWWVDTRGHKGAVSVSTAPSADQVGKVVWRYVRQHHEKSLAFADEDDSYPPLPGYVTQDNEWKFDNGELKAWGRKPADHSQSTFQGIHAAGGVLAVVDEANGVADGIWTNIYAITTGEHDRILAIANPDVAAGEFFKIFHDDNPDWYKMTVSAFDTPNFTGEDVPAEMRAGLIQPSWVEERRRAWGEEDPRWKSKIMAEFDLSSSNLLFGYDTINAGIAAEVRPLHEDEIFLGVDVARFGDDKTVIYKNHGGYVRYLTSWNKCDITETSRRIHNHAIEEGATQVRIDGIGIGAGVVDTVVQHSEDRYKVISFVGNKSSPNVLKWYNARAHWYDNTREEMRLGQLDIAHDDKNLHDELTSIGFMFPPGKGMLIESKDDIMKRLGESPDYADAFIYSVAPLGFDINSPLSQVRPGEHVEIDMMDILLQREMQISPL